MIFNKKSLVKADASMYRKKDKSLQEVFQQYKNLLNWYNCLVQTEVPTVSLQSDLSCKFKLLLVVI